MLSVTRKQKIKDLILEKKSATVSELAKLFSVTDETIRRDLRSLESEGVLLRSYGGAFVQTGVENLIDYSIRSTVYLKEKGIIAEKCRSLIQNGDVVFLDHSTTTFAIAKAVEDMRLTLITNSLPIINLLSKKENIRLIGIGGFFSLKELAFYGSKAQKALNEYYVDKSFFSCRTLSIDQGVTDSNDDLAQIRKTILQRSKECYLVADYTKFNQASFITICGYDCLSAIITDRPLSQEWHTSLQKYGCRIYDAAPEQAGPADGVNKKSDAKNDNQPKCR
ncbi:putative HTH-type transcriptional regulator YdjF [Caprobacter fermentans]|uniref:DeoR/GlpR transcriptional regulator n=1 Tax=Caproicibacter fermentans TaxID=2576756 RepID=A0A6N8HWA8_9FIRM|nr:DeoR/GlpR family DNA-binding transcription regulator [Caproicibacter fermentans]MVB10104.1 putative HTH-type transcriptional regulator YdjF [Caproicibacter fermentans]QNK40175.1 DeoR/GlpR transcriptional regulator [Caproicibacter fermentans]